MHAFSYLVASCCDDTKMPAKHATREKKNEKKKQPSFELKTTFYALTCTFFGLCKTEILVRLKI